MKQIWLFFVFLLLFFSCKKEQQYEDEVALCLVTNDFPFEVSTKTSAVTSITGKYYWVIESGVWKSYQGGTYVPGGGIKYDPFGPSTVSDNKIYTGYYKQPYASYFYYACNVSLKNYGSSYGSQICVDATNTTDVVCGISDYSDSNNPSVQLKHIFARTGSLTCQAQSGYSISGVSWEIIGSSEINGTSGTFDIGKEQWISASVKLNSYTSLNSSSDMYLIPGTYTMRVSYTLEKGDYRQSFTKTGNVTLEGGKINNISCTASGGAAQEIVLSLSLSGWNTTILTPTLG